MAGGFSKTCPYRFDEIKYLYGENRRSWQLLDDGNVYTFSKSPHWIATLQFTNVSDTWRVQTHTIVFLIKNKVQKPKELGSETDKEPR